MSGLETGWRVLVPAQPALLLNQLHLPSLLLNLLGNLDYIVYPSCLVIRIYCNINISEWSLAVWLQHDELAVDGSAEASLVAGGAGGCGLEGLGGGAESRRHRHPHPDPLLRPAHGPLGLPAGHRAVVTRGGAALLPRHAALPHCHPARDLGHPRCAVAHPRGT